MPQGPAIPFLIVGGVPTLIALVLALRTMSFLLKAKRTIGTVVGTQVHHSRTRRRAVATYSPRIRYVVDGESFEHSPAISSSSDDSFSEGMEVGLLYDRGSPWEARIDRFKYLWFAPTLLGFIGGSCIVLAVLMIVNGAR